MAGDNSLDSITRYIRRAVPDRRDLGRFFLHLGRHYRVRFFVHFARTTSSNKKHTGRPLTRFNRTVTNYGVSVSDGVNRRSLDRHRVRSSVLSEFRFIRGAVPRTANRSFRKTRRKFCRISLGGFPLPMVRKQIETTYDFVTGYKISTNIAVRPVPKSLSLSTGNGAVDICRLVVNFRLVAFTIILNLRRRRARRNF